MQFSFHSKLWQWPGKAAWHFLTVPEEFYEDLKTISTADKKGFGSIKVAASIGKSSWDTSIFPDNKSKSFLLPVKKSIRQAESIQIDESIEVQLSLK
jgi:hypothetical protein